MAKSEVGKEINRLYSNLGFLQDRVKEYVLQIEDCKADAKNFKFNPYECYFYSPKVDYLDDECDLPEEQKMYAYTAFFKKALKAVEREIRKVKKQIKKLQRSQNG